MSGVRTRSSKAYYDQEQKRRNANYEAWSAAQKALPKSVRLVNNAPVVQVALPASQKRKQEEEEEFSSNVLAARAAMLKKSKSVKDQFAGLSLESSARKIKWKQPETTTHFFEQSTGNRSSSTSSSSSASSTQGMQDTLPTKPMRRMTRKEKQGLRDRVQQMRREKEKLLTGFLAQQVPLPYNKSNW